MVSETWLTVLKASGGTFVLLGLGSGSELGRDEASSHGLYLRCLLTCLSNLIPLCLTYPVQNKRKYALNPFWGLLSLSMITTILLLSIFGFERPQWSWRKLSVSAMPIDNHQKAMLFLLWLTCKSKALYMLEWRRNILPFLLLGFVSLSHSLNRFKEVDFAKILAMLNAY